LVDLGILIFSHDFVQASMVDSIVDTETLITQYSVRIEVDLLSATAAMARMEEIKTESVK